MMKHGINDFRREHRDECSKSMKMKCCENMCGEFSQAHAKRNV